MSKADTLTLKEQRFALAYVLETAGNGTQAARLAGYKGDDNVLAGVAYENLRKPKIRAYIQNLLVDWIDEEALKAELAKVALIPVDEAIKTHSLREKVRSLELLFKHKGMLQESKKNDADIKRENDNKKWAQERIQELREQFADVPEEMFNEMLARDFPVLSEMVN